MVSHRSPWTALRESILRASSRRARDARELREGRRGLRVSHRARATPLLCDEPSRWTTSPTATTRSIPRRTPRTGRTYFFDRSAEVPKAVAAGKTQGRPVRVLYHSHLDAGAYFSETDAAAATMGGDEPSYEGLSYLVTSVRQGDGRRPQALRVGPRARKTFVEIADDHRAEMRRSSDRLDSRLTRASQGIVTRRMSQQWLRRLVHWLVGLGQITLAAMLAAELARARRACRDARRRRGAHAPLQGPRLLARRIATPTSAASASWPSSSRGRGACAMTAAISPYSDIRDEQRAPQIGDSVEVYCSCPIQALSARDAKGLYKKALAGEIKHFTGVDDPYEAPDDADVVVHTDKETKEQSLAKILAKLEELGFIRAAARCAGTAAVRRKRLIAPHGGELVNRWVTGPRKSASPRRPSRCRSSTLDERAASDVEMIAVGGVLAAQGLHELEGLPAGRARDAARERPALVAAHHARGLAEAGAASLRVGPRSRSGARDGRIVADARGERQVACPTRTLEAREVYRTTDDEAPRRRVPA